MSVWSEGDRNGGKEVIFGKIRGLWCRWGRSYRGDRETGDAREMVRRKLVNEGGENRCVLWEWTERRREEDVIDMGAIDGGWGRCLVWVSNR